MPLNELNHVTVRTTDMDGTRKFYEQVLGMHAGDRPDLGFPGYWLYCGDHAVIHLVPPGRELGGGAGDNTGNFDHVAFSATDFPAVRQRLKDHGLSFRERHVPGRRFRQVFVFDPNRVMVEINFANTD